MPATPLGTLQPRSQVIDRAWRALGPGLEPLSGPGGAPLTRAVKLLVLPLVLRPVLRPELAGDLLTDEAADLAAGLLREDGPRLAAAAGWFTLLKRVRRALRVVGGNPQDLYFQRCYELAAEHGAPRPPDAEEVARKVVLELAARDGGRTVEALKAHLRDPATERSVAEALSRAWGARPVPAAPGAVPEANALSLADTVLDGCVPADRAASGNRGAGRAPGGAVPADGPRPRAQERGADRRDTGGAERGTAESALAALVGDGHGTRLGAALWASGAVSDWGPEGVPPHLGLSAAPLPPRPGVGSTASTAALPAPLDRTLYERVFTVLRAPGHHDLPPVPELVDAETARSCSPLGLSDESLRVALLVGGRLAAGLDPLGTAPGPTRAHRAIDRRWRRESSVARARRMTVSPFDAPIAHGTGAGGPGAGLPDVGRTGAGAPAAGLPDAEPPARSDADRAAAPAPDGGTPRTGPASTLPPASGEDLLADLGRSLRTPWIAYTRRLWARLHGRDAHAAGIDGPAELWSLLDGVSYSVLMDHRARVRAALRTLTDTTSGSAA
ncbi:hypothetical protein [Nocardiopsis sp. CA-288880]|uniref:hypothetical protein n=1 Tax=Nocardiopsis sp. CA-288880 TaxID=3239995 RepID=UPI003D98B787